MNYIDEKYKLLAALKTLREEEIKNRSLYNAPWIVRPEHVRHYFDAYGDYLKQAGELEIIDSDFLNLRKHRLAVLHSHRDNMSSLMGMVGELTSVVEEDLKPHEEAMIKLEQENSKLKAKLSKITEESAHKLE